MSEHFSAGWYASLEHDIVKAEQIAYAYNELVNDCQKRISDKTLYDKLVASTRIEREN